MVLGGVQSSTLKSINPASLATLTGLIGGLIGSQLENSASFGLGTSIPSYAILFQALANSDNSNILSAPHIIAIDNEKAELSVGNNIPYRAGLSFGGLPTTPGATTDGVVTRTVLQFVKKHWIPIYMVLDEILDDLCGCRGGGGTPPPPPPPEPERG